MPMNLEKIEKKVMPMNLEFECIKTVLQNTSDETINKVGWWCKKYFEGNVNL